MTLSHEPAVDTAPQKVKFYPTNYAPHRAQRRAHRALRLARFIVLVAGRRGGKTKCGGGIFVDRMLKDLEAWSAINGAWQRGAGKAPTPSVQYMVVAPVYALLEEPRSALQKYLGGMVAEGGLIVHQSDQTWWLVEGVRIDFRSGEHPKRLVSQGLNGIWLEEAARLKPEVWIDNLRPALSDKLGWCIFTSTPLGKNWLWREIWAKADPSAAAELGMIDGLNPNDILDANYCGISWTTADNDALTHLAEEMELARRTMPYAFFARNYLASFETFVGQLFQLDRHRHFTSDPAPSFAESRRKFVGGDLGTRHKSSFTLIVESRESPKPIWHEVETDAASDILFDEHHSWEARRRGDRGSWTARVWRILRDYAGESGWRSIPVFLPADRPEVKRQFEARGFKVMEAFQRHDPAVDFFSVLFAVDRIKIRSANLWRCVEALHTPEVGKNSTKVWVDEDDDEFDGLRYALSDPIRLGESPARNAMTALGWR